MKARIEVLQLIALVMTFAGAICLAAPLGAQTATAASVDFTGAAVAEVRNAQGQVVLSGKFVATDGGDDDIERRATLSATGVGADASGEAEVEVARSGNPKHQEVEFSVRNVPPGGVLTFVIDGKVFATVTADSRGRAEHERDVPLPARSGAP